MSEYLTPWKRTFNIGVNLFCYKDQHPFFPPYFFQFVLGWFLYLPIQIDGAFSENPECKMELIPARKKKFENRPKFDYQMGVK